MEIHFSVVMKEFLSFIRLETCLFVTGISVAGYAIFNAINNDIFFLVAAILLGTGASYAYNHITDSKEDSINSRALNYFVVKRRLGKTLVTTLFLAGFASALMLPSESVIVYIVLMFSSLAYSGLRIKAVFLAKNLFTALTISLTFLAGALTSHGFDANVLSCMYFIALFGFTLNLLGDIRGVEGDRIAGVRTIPAVFGMEAAKKAVYSTSVLFLASVLLSGQTIFYALAPFLLLVSIFLHRNEHAMSRLSILSSFIFFSAFVLMVNLYGGA